MKVGQAVGTGTKFVGVMSRQGTIGSQQTAHLGLARYTKADVYSLSLMGAFTQLLTQWKKNYLLLYPIAQINCPLDTATKVAEKVSTTFSSTWCCVAGSRQLPNNCSHGITDG